jgi:hypothetical protein
VSPDCNVPDGQLSGLLPSLVIALRYPLLIGFFLPIFILAVEIPAQETGASADGRAKARIAGDCPDESATGRTTSPAGKRTLLGFTHPSAPPMATRATTTMPRAKFRIVYPSLNIACRNFTPHPNPPP